MGLKKSKSLILLTLFLQASLSWSIKSIHNNLDDEFGISDHLKREVANSSRTPSTEANDRIFFLQPLGAGAATSCATNAMCCRWRCDIVNPICVNPAGGLRCHPVGVMAPATAGTACVVNVGCPACFTDTTVTCRNTECTSIPGGQICAF